MGVRATMERDGFTITRQLGIKDSATTAASIGEERKSKFTQYKANLLCRAPREVNRKQSRLFGGLRYHTWHGMLCRSVLYGRATGSRRSLCGQWLGHRMLDL